MANNDPKNRVPGPTADEAREMLDEARRQLTRDDAARISDPELFKRAARNAESAAT